MKPLDLANLTSHVKPLFVALDYSRKQKKGNFLRLPLCCELLSRVKNPGLLGPGAQFGTWYWWFT